MELAHRLYKKGNYSGAFASIEKLAKGLSNHRDVANSLKIANESYEEKQVLAYLLLFTFCWAVLF